MKALTGKWSLVTGASRGIGQQIAFGLADAGSNVILHARRAEHCDATLEKIRHLGVETLLVGGELGVLPDEQRVVDTVLETIGHVDILYNNAAVMSSWHDRIADIPMDEWRRVYEVNFFSLVRLTNAFYPVMRQRKWGRIVNLVTGMENTPQLLPYSAAKASVLKFTRELSVELTGSNVLVNALDPGWRRTDMGSDAADYPVETVLPAALEPALLDDFGQGGRVYRAYDTDAD